MTLPVPPVPPVPPAMDDLSTPLTNWSGLVPGDVVKVAVRLEDRATRQPFWWTTFRAVVEIRGSRMQVLRLRMTVDDDKDFWWLTRGDKEVIVTGPVPVDRWPQGVSAMMMKHTMQKRIPPRG